MSETKNSATAETGKVLKNNAVDVKAAEAKQKEAAKPENKPAEKPAEKSAPKPKATAKPKAAAKPAPVAVDAAAVKASAAVKVADDKPKEVIENETNFELMGALARGHGMGTDDTARIAHIKEQYAMPAETPKVETVTDATLEKVLNEEEKAGDAAMKEAEKETEKEQEGK